MRVQYEVMKNEFKRVLMKKGFSEKNAEEGAKIFADNSLSGVFSHGLNRFPRVISYLEKGEIDPETEPTVESSFGAFEKWDGHRGFGPLNAWKAMDRACDLAREYGIGIVSLGNNNHWMRGGSYGYEACDRGMIGICWSNTMPNMPCWGGKDVKIGNNPIIFAVPRKDGRHVVIDCAVSQFSYGKIENTRLNGKLLPLPGGYDTEGNLTRDPEEIEKTKRVLPMGYWKGSGLSIALDMIATILTNGNAVHTIGTFPDEIGLSQVMIAIDPLKAGSREQAENIVEGIIADLKTSIPVEDGKPVSYPGENSASNREDFLKNGIPVVEEIWNKVVEM